MPAEGLAPGARVLNDKLGPGDLVGYWHRVLDLDNLDKRWGPEAAELGDAPPSSSWQEFRCRVRF